MSRELRSAWIICLSLLAVGCGGGGGADGEPIVADLRPAASTTAIFFPPANSLAEAPKLGILGTIADPQGVTAVRVNGVAAASSDGFATWRAVVPIFPGANSVVVDLEGTGGARMRGVGTRSFRAVADVLSGLAAVARVPSSDTLYVFDRFREGVYRVDPTTGITALVSGPDRGSGTPFAAHHVKDVAVDAARGRVLVLEEDRLVGVTIATGAREEVSGPAAGAGPDIDFTEGLAVDAVGDRAIVVNRQSPSVVLSIDLATGDRAALPSGSGPAFGRATDLVLASSTVAYVTAGRGASASEGPRVMEVDLGTGDRAVISAAGVRGAGQAFDDPERLVYDAASQTIFVSDFDGRSIRAVDVATGDRTAFADGDFGAGIDLFDVRGMTGDFGRGRFVVIDRRQDAVVAVDAITADRTVLYSYRQGTGGDLKAPEGLACDPSSGEAFVLDTDTENLWRIDLDTGNRELVASAASGPAPPWTQPVGLDLDPVGNLAHVVDKSEGLLVRVDLATGTRTVVSSPTVGVGPVFGIPHGISLDVAAGRAWVSDSKSAPEGGLWSVDLTTGARSKVSDGTLGAGPLLDLPEGCVFDPLRGDVVSLDIRNDTVLRVDPATGDRTLLSGNGSGAGPAFGNVHDVNIDTARDRILGIDNNLDVLFSIHPVTGARSIVSGPARGLGPGLVTPEHAVVGPLGSYLLVDGNVGALLLIEPSSGDRVILSR